MNRVPKAQWLRMVISDCCPDKELPRTDEEMFILNSAILITRCSIELTDSVNEITEYGTRRHRRKMKFFSKEAEHIIVDYICEVKGFTFNKEKKYIKWIQSMQEEYEANEVAWTKRIRTLADKILMTLSIASR